MHDPALDRRQRCRRWRAERPFWGGTALAVSGLVLLLPAYTTFRIGEVLVSISTISGVSTLLLGALMLVCAGSALLRPSTRVTAGVSGMILALVALPAANFGGFLVGTLLGVLGASLTMAWQHTNDTA
ncbi:MULTISPECIES: DUF6114 domain-containing protein [Rhodococcus]|uniref:DUF6114 domain-containing protein n=1 Tax=Rhodococcus TaxID=1827 RepID=UPI000C9B3B44|nr:MULTISPECIES: DUF6114 domain-containing protein [Rhodococcus]PND52998.1 hypothetical protein CQZ88_05720 [Rhodococcus sp. ENV425]WKX01799.1 DUF6114 domain-containing protein [Rhodococcus aetherivorans]